NHNQNDVLRPNEKMIRPVCMDCHGLGFAIDALADPDLVSSNFRGRPETRIESIEWATRRVREKAGGANQ
ncbi:MAG: NrfA- nitrite reduction protein, partial [Pseudomonadota bacterium]